MVAIRNYQMNLTFSISRLVAGMALLIVVTSTTTRTLADSAAVLPASISRMYGNLYHYLPTTQRYNSDGDREDLAFPFTSATLDSNVLTNLQPLDALLGATASIGDVAVAYKYDIEVFDVGYSYGVTDKFTVGFHIPYYWINNKVDASFDSTSANVGLNPGDGTCCIPISLGGQPMDNNDVQNLIYSEYGFNAIESWNGEGVGDIEIGAKYQLFLDKSSALAITGGLRSPTGRTDNPDDLTDVPWSYGNYALLFRLHFDYNISNFWKKNRTQIHQIIPASGDVLFNTTFRFDYMIGDNQVKRIGDSPDQVFTTNREKVSRKLGNLINIELSAKYYMTETFAFTLLYSYGFKQEDRISGNLGYNYESLETYTDSSQQIIILRASYSTMSSYRRKQYSVPMELSFSYRDRFAGDGPPTSQANPILETSWVIVGWSILL